MGNRLWANCRPCSGQIDDVETRQASYGVKEFGEVEQQELSSTLGNGENYKYDDSKPEVVANIRLDASPTLRTQNRKLVDVCTARLTLLELDQFHRIITLISCALRMNLLEPIPSRHICFQHNEDISDNVRAAIRVSHRDILWFEVMQTEEKYMSMIYVAVDQSAILKETCVAERCTKCKTMFYRQVHAKSQEETKDNT